MSPAQRRQMVDREHPSLSIVRQCTLLGVSRSSIYYRPRAASEEDLSLMGEIDRQYLETPFYGSRRMKAWLERRGIRVSRKRVQRLMRAMGLRAIYRRPSTSRRSPEHRVYPYLLRNARITRPNEVWAADITYLPMARGPWVPLPGGSHGLAQPVRGGLAAVQHPGSRLLRRGAGGGPLGKGQPEVFNTDQGSQFTSWEFTQAIKDRGVRISMDGKGRHADNIVRGAAVADGEVRRSVPESLRQRPGGPEGAGRLLPVLQRAQAPSGPGLPDPGRGPPWGAGSRRRGV